ncbi:hypothetical protein, partial [Caballeronia sp. GAFFF3]|uniref:hypothetical protein n=1 Tax=Caballeronia sp. GAFFF3 TaxID=2921759 RepID=UPI0020299241
GIANGFSLSTDGISVFVSGDFLTYRGASAPYIIKLDANSGVLDPTFNQTVNSNVSLRILGFLNGQIFATAGGFSAVTSYRTN